VPRPNVVLILADDLGFSDLGCYGGEIRTPVLDELGRNGVRLAQFYNTARCSPSRASLLTGLHPHQTGIGVLTRPDLPEGYPGTLDPQCTTIAERLRDTGWRTWVSGKWHLAGDVETLNDSWPTRKGFDTFFGTLAGCSSYFSPQTLTRGEEPAADAAENPDFYYTEAISDEAVGWIDRLGADGDHAPFFLYLAYTAPHWPLHARQEDIDTYAGAFGEGWDRLRERRLERLVEEEIIRPGASLSDRDPTQPAWVEEQQQGWQAKRMQVYAAQVQAMDAGIGRVVEALDRAGLREDTIIVFVSDNGASAEELPISDRAAFAHKDEAMLTGTRDGRPLRIGNESGIVPGPEDTYASYGVPWANLSNTPLRRYKRWVHEGGISTPFLVSWPNGRLADGSVIHAPFQLVDVVPTLLEATGAPAPGGLEGRSMLPALRGGEVADAPLYWEHIGNAAVRRGRWKLVRDHPGAWELYDIEADRTEQHDLAPGNPELAGELAEKWQRWADRVGVIPWEHMLQVYADRGMTAEDAEQ
jgi:arylsulfatase